MGEIAVRRADFLMALAYATDLATGHSRDFALRSCVLAMRFADAMGLDASERAAVYHQALLRYIGCNADTHLLAAAFGDEIALRQDLASHRHGQPVRSSATSSSAPSRASSPTLPPAELAAGGGARPGRGAAGQRPDPRRALRGRPADRASGIGLPPEIRENLGQIYERWDGKGLPRGLQGEAVKFPVRLVTLAQDAIALDEHHGFEAMMRR